MRKFPLDSHLFCWKKKPLRTCQERKDFSIKWVFFAILSSRVVGESTTNVLPSLSYVSFLSCCIALHPKLPSFLSQNKNFSVGAITKYVVKLINDLVRHEKKRWHFGLSCCHGCICYFCTTIATLSIWPSKDLIVVIAAKQKQHWGGRAESWQHKEPLCLLLPPSLLFSCVIKCLIKGLS